MAAAPGIRPASSIMDERLGIISDTHGRSPRTRRAVEVLLARGATRILHLGDVGDESVLDALAGTNATVVFGNCDDAHSLGRYAAFLGIEVAHPGTIIETKSMRIGLTHGHLEREVERLFAAEVDVLLHGHTHTVRDEQVGRTRVMNPGALHRANRHTALLLDLGTGVAEWIEIPD
ncbi:MAG: YfcE family phosphodiesterase [Planctomycetota bacterium]